MVALDGGLMTIRNSMRPSTTHGGRESRKVTAGGHLQRGGFKVPEWIGTILFFAAVGLTAAKLNKDFAEKGLLGYAMLLIMIIIYAAAVGLAYV